VVGKKRADKAVRAPFGCGLATPRSLALLLVIFPLLWFASQAATITNFFPAFGPPGTVVTINGTGLAGATNVILNGTNYADFNIVSSTQIQTVIPLGATSGSFAVGVSGAQAVSATNFLVPPVITSFNPGTGTNPTSVTIFGANFSTTNTTVTFFGSSPTNGIVTAQNQVVVVVPTNAANGPITVTTSAGSATTSSNFIVSVSPTITDFSPGFGQPGDDITIDGSNFLTNSTTIKFGNISATTVSVVASTQLHATVPTGATNGPITVSTSHGSYVSSNIFITGFTSEITDFNPIYGAAGALVTIDGIGFNTSSGVILGGARVTSITVSNNSQLQVAVPATATNGPITVLSAHGSFTTSSNFLASAGPVVLSFSPASGAVNSQVTLQGFNFTNVTTVKFGSRSVSVTPTQDNQLIVNVPTGATNAPIQVISSTGTFTTSSNFIVTGAGPIITGFTPANGAPGTPVTVTGSFSSLGNPGVEFNGTTAGYSFTSYNEVQAFVPVAATSGPISLLNSGGTAVSSTLFYLQPWITSFAPPSNIVNSTITLTGRNLTNTTSLVVNGVPWTFNAGTNQIIANVPSNAVTGPIVVTAPGGIFIDTNVFKILPKIYSFSPLLAPVGATVTISGTSLFNVTNVQFNGVNAIPSFTTSNQVQVTIPPFGTTGPITVATPDGTSSSVTNFTVTQPSQVVLTKTASSQIVGPGSNVTYTLTVTNQGPSIITGLSIVDTLPAGLNYISAVSTRGTCSFNSGTVTCNVGILTNNLGLTITITGEANVTAILTNTATLQFAEGNINPQNNSASAQVVYITPSGLILNIQRMTTNVILSWSNSGVPFLLEYSTNLASPANWLTDTAFQTIIGPAIHVTNATTNPFTFFQLKAE
jgi:hypothetical protein